MTPYPVLAHSVDAWPLFDSEDSTSSWAVGSDSTDRYLAVPACSVHAVRVTLQLMDGSRSIEEISTTARCQIGRDIDVSRLVGLATAAGLLSSSRSPDGDRSEFDRLSVVLFELPLQSASRWIENHAGALPSIWLAAQAAIAFLAVMTIAVFPAASASGHSSLAALIAACAMSVLAHEASHYLVAFDKGIRATSLSVAIYAGFIPVVYVRLPGIFRLPSSDRLRIWIAGCVCNAVIALASNALARVPGFSLQTTEFWLGVSRWNLTLIAVSLVPFLPTDGYFILSTILRTQNLRSRAYRAAAALARGQFTGSDWKAFSFLLAASLALTAGILSSASAWVAWAERENIPTIVGWGTPILFLFCAWIFRRAAQVVLAKVRS